MNINERLQAIDIFLNVIAGEELPGMVHDDMQWMHDTIKQLQEENESLNTLADKLEIGIKRQSVKHGKAQQRIAELEKERREITMAHDAFLRDLEMNHAETYIKAYYHQLFDEPIHLSEQVRKAKLSADAE
jgi:hypothetical protein